MEAITRREVAGAAFAGAIALAAAAPAAVADDDKPAIDPQDQAELDRVIACGLTQAEAECWLLTSKAAGAFFRLPKLHDMDDHEIAHAIHVVQHKLLSRPAYRQYKELAQNPPK